MVANKRLEVKVYLDGKCIGTALHLGKTYGAIEEATGKHIWEVAPVLKPDADEQVRNERYVADAISFLLDASGQVQGNEIMLIHH